MRFDYFVYCCVCIVFIFVLDFVTDSTRLISFFYLTQSCISLGQSAWVAGGGVGLGWVEASGRDVTARSSNGCRRRATSAKLGWRQSWSSRSGRSL